MILPSGPVNLFELWRFSNYRNSNILKFNYKNFLRKIDGDLELVRIREVRSNYEKI